MPKADTVEIAARGMYGKHWDGPPEKMPGEAMKDVWRKYARDALAALEVADYKIVKFVKRESVPFDITEN